MLASVASLVKLMYSGVLFTKTVSKAKVIWKQSMHDKDALTLIQHGITEVISSNELTELLTANQPLHGKGRALRVKAGFDPTASDLHLGHTIVFNKLRQFQQLGHEVIFLIGDFTGMIGDPTGKNITRKQLTKEEVMQYALTYQEQVFKILDKAKTRVVFNSSWLNELGAEGIIRLAAKYTVARMIERDDFEKRYRGGEPIAIHEFLYPLMQGYDSVELQADIELGGTDQKFNLLVGRELQQRYGQKPQIVMTLPLLEGTDGVQKMSKSLGNYIGITESPQDIFGKIMSISDTLMWRYFDLLSFRPLAEIEQFRTDVLNGANPRDIKFILAEEIVARFHSQQDAIAAKAAFVAQFSHGVRPDDIVEVELAASNDGKLAITSALKTAGAVASVSEAQRLIKQGGLRMDEVRVEDDKQVISAGSAYVFQVGKRKFIKIKVVY